MEHMISILQVIAIAVFVAFFGVIATRGRSIIKLIKQNTSRKSTSTGLRIAIALCYSVPFAVVSEQSIQQLFNTSPLNSPNFVDETAEHIGIIIGAAIAGMLVGLIDSFHE